MSSLDSNSGLAGIFAILVSVLAVSAIITLVTDSLFHWLPVVLGIVVGMMAVKAINGRTVLALLCR